MISDPYKVLGVPSTATDDEVKQAYRRLAKRYHPDANPGDKTAEQKMQQINAAYDEILNRRANPGSSSQGQGYGGSSYGSGYGQGYGPFGGWGGFGGYGQGYGSYGADDNTASGSSYYAAAENYIRFGRYREAQNVLNGITDRDARWYYLSARTNAGLGNRVLAKQQIETALKMEPDNAQYRAFSEQLNNPSRAYSSYGNTYSCPSYSGIGRICLGLCAAETLLGFCCRSGYGCYCC